MWTMNGVDKFGVKNIVYTVYVYYIEFVTSSVPLWGG